MEALKNLIQKNKEKQKQELSKKATEIHDSKNALDDLLQKRETLMEENEEYNIDVEALRKRILNDPEIISKVKTTKSETEKIIWNFKNTSEDIENLLERNAQFISLFKNLKDELKRFDFGINVEYRDKCDDLKTFLIFEIERFEKMHAEKEEIGTQKKIDLRSDLTIFVDLLSRYV